LSRGDHKSLGYIHKDGHKPQEFLFTICSGESHSEGRHNILIRILKSMAISVEELAALAGETTWIRTEYVFLERADQSSDENGDGIPRGVLRLTNRRLFFLNTGGSGTPCKNIIVEVICHNAIDSSYNKFGDYCKGVNSVHPYNQKPSQGDKLSVSGRWVQDIDQTVDPKDRHLAWNEIHPASNIHKIP
jgi:hypothetical protein